jgi:subtilase family serine protease
MTQVRSVLAGGALALVAVAPVFAQEREHYATPPIHVHGAATRGPTGYTPTQVKHAYGFDAVANQGAGQIIGIVDAYGSPTIVNDLAVFSKQFGLPAANLIVAMPQGTPHVNGGWSQETSLDVEWAHAIAPQATILLVETADASFTNLFAGVDYAVQHGASVVSMSWGSNEFSSEASYDGHFSVPGVTFFASSGDSGAGVIYPAASPYCVAVGGTTLKLDAAGNVLSESGWSGSGGGTSQYEAAPAWQAPLGFTQRGVPDVAYNADPNTGVPVYDSTRTQGQSGWLQFGGTSAGAPQWAALMARVNGARAAAGASTEDDANEDLYGFLNTSAFRDITSGSNGFSCTPGWDYVTGIGSPHDDQLDPLLQQIP